jgi:glutamate synthase domain-containing protein 3
MTMTKHNPRFDPPELWVLGSTGDSFAEFMAGGIAVICGHDTVRQKNVLGYRPCVGMVGGKIFFRGAHGGFSEHDARLKTPDDDEWQWLTRNMKEFLADIDRPALYEALTETAVSGRSL